jgi:hypothetical protein
MSQQTFSPGANTFAKISVVLIGLVSVLLIGYLILRMFSPYTKNPVGIPVEQPVQFSHELHSGQLNVDCRYCHTSVEESPYAGIPDTHTCMTCHSQIATYSELLEPIRQSYETGERIAWQKVHNLADYVYFNHSAHVNKGVGCETCHGRVDQMPIVWQVETMTMRWCLDCHFDPAENLRPVDQVTTHGWETAQMNSDQQQASMSLQSSGVASMQSLTGEELLEINHVNVEGLGDCAVCHR